MTLCGMSSRYFKCCYSEVCEVRRRVWTNNLELQRVKCEGLGMQIKSLCESQPFNLKCTLTFQSRTLLMHDNHGKMFAANNRVVSKFGHENIKGELGGHVHIH